MAANDILLMLDGIKGESTDSKYADALEIGKYTIGVVNDTTPGTGGGSGQGKAVFHALTCIAPISVAFPNLSDFCANGTPIPKATLYVRKQGAGEQQDYLTYVFEHVLVKSVKDMGPSAGGHNMTLVLTYQTITQEYKPQQ